MGELKGSVVTRPLYPTALETSSGNSAAEFQEVAAKLW